MYSGRVGVQYKRSNRLTISMDTGAYQIEGLNPNSYSLRPIIPSARSEEFNVGVTYAASPRTEFQTVLLTREAQSPFSSYLITSIYENVLRKMTPHWQVFLQGGGVYLTYLGGERAPAVTSYLAGGGTSYSGRENSAEFTFNRTIGDSLGIAPGSTYSFQGSWRWRRPNSSWGVDASATGQRLNGGQFGSFSLWQAGVGVTRALSDRTWVRLEFTWLLDTVNPYGFATTPQARGVRLTFGWNPAAYGPRGLPGPASGSSAIR